MSKCDPIKPLVSVPSARPSSIGDPNWGMYIVPDDPLRDTPEKARLYYTLLFERYPQLHTTKANARDIDAAAKILGWFNA